MPLKVFLISNWKALFLNMGMDGLQQMKAHLTSGRVDAGRNVEVAESVGLRHVAPALPVAVVTALMVRQAAGE